MSGREVAIFGAGLCCPIGTDSATASKAYAAGDRALRRERALVAVDGLPPTVATVFPLAECRDYVERLLRLARAAVADALSAAPHDLGDVPLRLVLPHWMRGTPIFGEFRRRLLADWPAGVAEMKPVFGGSADGLAELSAAAAAVADGYEEAAIAAAVDSHIAPDVMDALAIQGRSFGAGNPHGLVPGEGAAAVLLLRADAGGSAPPAVGRLLCCVEGREGAPRSAGPGGRALAGCYARALDAFAPDRLLIDFNGERHRAEEMGFALAAGGARLGDLAADPETPLSGMGDPGAAAGLALAALSLFPPPRRWLDRAAKREPGAPSVAMVSASSVLAGRAVAMIERRVTEGG